jgi:hypothetical protein
MLYLIKFWAQMENNTNILEDQSARAHSSLEESSPELLEIGLDRARAFPLFTTSLKLSSSLGSVPPRCLGRA